MSRAYTAQLELTVDASSPQQLDQLSASRSPPRLITFQYVSGLWKPKRNDVISATLSIAMIPQTPITIASSRSGTYYYHA